MRRTTTASQHASCPSFAGSVTPVKDEGAGKAGCGPHPWPPCEQECTGQEPQVWPRHPGLPCAMALTLIRALLGDRLSCPRIATTRYARRAGHQHRDARTTRLHVRDLPFVRVRHARCGSSRPPLPASRLVTIARTPLASRRDIRKMKLIWGICPADYFRLTIWTGQISLRSFAKLLFARRRRSGRGLRLSHR